MSALYISIGFLFLLFMYLLYVQEYSYPREIDPLNYIDKLEPKTYKQQPDIIGEKLSLSGGAISGNITRDIDNNTEELETFIQRPLNPKEQMENNIRDMIDKNYMFEGDTTLGDRKLYDKMNDMGRRAKQSIDIRSKFDKNSLIPYVAEEINDAANSIWWENDALEQFM